MRKKRNREIYLIHLPAGRVEICPSAESRDYPITTIILPKNWTPKIKKGDHKRLQINLIVRTDKETEFTVPFRLIIFFSDSFEASNLMQVLDIKEPSGMHQTIDFKEIISNNFLKLNSDKNLLNSIALSIRDWYRGNISFALLTRRTMLHVSFEEHLFANVKLIDIEMEKPELYIPKKQYV